MPRTTSADVQAVLLQQYKTGTVLTSYIATASAVIDQIVICAAAKGITLSDAMLERLEAYMAAHFYGVAYQLYRERQTGRASAKFQGRDGMGFESTDFGQQALSMDSSGCLASMQHRVANVGMSWLGLPPSEQLDFDERD